MSQLNAVCFLFLLPTKSQESHLPIKIVFENKDKYMYFWKIYKYVYIVHVIVFKLFGYNPCDTALYN